jgi:hypothetical protein
VGALLRRFIYIFSRPPEERKNMGSGLLGYCHFFRQKQVKTIEFLLKEIEI